MSLGRWSWRVAIALLLLILVGKLAMGCNIVVRPAFVALSADGIPLDRYGPDAARAVIAFFALWGFNQLLIAVAGLWVLGFRRSLVPALYAILLMEQIGRKLVLYIHPLHDSGTMIATAINAVQTGMIVVGLALSLLGARTKQCAGQDSTTSS